MYYYKMNIDDDNIRPPDSTITEQLLYDDVSDFEKDIDIAIQESYNEIINYNEANKKYELDIIENFNNELLERKNNCNEILFTINRISKFDKNIKEILDIIEPILELYCYQNINYYIFDEVTYNKIFNLISQIRLNKKNIDFLKTIIVKEDKNSLNYIIIE